ncbi:MAG: polyphenol oxidase family protein [Actinomycetota bacterium]
MEALDPIPVATGSVRVVFTDRSDGDFRVRVRPPLERQAEQARVASLAERRGAIAAGPWTSLRQVHGARTVLVTSAGDQADAEADAAVTTAASAPISVLIADCAPVVLVAESGVAVAHAGWRGLVNGVVADAGATLRAVGGAPIAAHIGPCIGPAAYEFGAEDLARMTNVFGSAVASETAEGRPALNVAAAVAVACEQAGWPEPPAAPHCTSDLGWFSHRTRGDAERQTAVAWIEPHPSS